MQIFNIVKYAYSISNIYSSVNIARIFKCHISKSKLALSEYNVTYLSAIAFISFTLSNQFLGGHPVYIYICICSQILLYGLQVILSTLQDEPLLLTHCAHAHCLQFEHSGNGLMSHIRETSKVTMKGCSIEANELLFETASI